MCSVDGSVGWAPPSYLKKCDNNDGDSDSDDEYISVHSCKILLHNCIALHSVEWF